MPSILLIVIDLLAIAVLAFGVYFPRHRRRDMVLPYVGLNVGVLGVTLALTTSSIGVGLGLGLFGVLSIIRLRSSELTQAEVAYYFVSLAMGLLGGLSFEPEWAGPSLIWLLVIVVFVADHPRLLSRYRNHVIRLDSAYTDERALVARLEELLGARVRRAVVLDIDLVNDTTKVDVRYELLPAPRATVAGSRRVADGPVGAIPVEASR